VKPIAPIQPKPADISTIKPQEEETKFTPEMYQGVDSDDDSDFEVLYEQTKDNHEDLNGLGHKPLFINDLIQALQSEDVKRFTRAIENSEALIRSQNSNDLDVMVHDFFAVLLRTEDKFAMPNFMELKYCTI